MSKVDLGWGTFLSSAVGSLSMALWIRVTSVGLKDPNRDNSGAKRDSGCQLDARAGLPLAVIGHRPGILIPLEGV